MKFRWFVCAAVMVVSSGYAGGVHGSQFPARRPAEMTAPANSQPRTVGDREYKASETLVDDDFEELASFLRLF